VPANLLIIVKSRWKTEKRMLNNSWTKMEVREQGTVNKRLKSGNERPEMEARNVVPK